MHQSTANRRVGLQGEGRDVVECNLACNSAGYEEHSGCAPIALDEQVGGLIALSSLDKKL